MIGLFVLHIYLTEVNCLLSNCILCSSCNYPHVRTPWHTSVLDCHAVLGIGVLLLVISSCSLCVVPQKQSYTSQKRPDVLSLISAGSRADLDGPCRSPVCSGTSHRWCCPTVETEACSLLACCPCFMSKPKKPESWAFGHCQGSIAPYTSSGTDPSGHLHDLDFLRL